MMNKITFFFIVVLFVSCQSGAPGLPENFDFGKTENNVYKNGMFNFELPIYEDWAVQTQEELDKLLVASQEVFSNADASLKRAIEASKVNTAYLFTAFKHEVGTLVDFNPSVMVMVENVNNFSGIKKGRDYLDETKKLFGSTGIEMDVAPGYKRKKIGGKDFDLMNVTTKYAGMEIEQEYYVIILKGFAFVIVDSYTNDEDKNLIHDLLDGIKM